MAESLNLKIYQYIVSEDFKRDKVYTMQDITSSVKQPIITNERTDTALDSASITILNKDANPIKPFTRIRIVYEVTNGSTLETTNQYWLVDNDDVELNKYSETESNRVYKHEVSLIEPTKWLERFDVDNTTITNMLMFLYQDAGVPSGNASENVTTGGLPHQIMGSIGGAQTVIYSSYYIPGSNYASPGTKFLKVTSNTTGVIDCSPRMLPRVLFSMLGVYNREEAGTLQSYTVTKPNGTQESLALDATTYTATAEGTYTFTQVYAVSEWGMNWTITFTWDVVWIELTNYTDKLPTRFSIADVIDRVLAKVTRENSVCLQNESPLFQLDLEQKRDFENMVAPEFTFTQSTLFDILMQIGTAIHAIPRLIIADADTDGLEWNTIHFDLLGMEKEFINEGETKITYAKTQRSENFATAFVSNVQNAFVSSNDNYITVTEPYNQGFISTRTESSDFEISNDHACIKTSRPIQRITELWCLYDYDTETYPPIDIAPYCKEKADYTLLTDYQYSYVASHWGQGTKETNIYYTRGDNVIRGLDYIAPNTMTIVPSWGTRLQTIKNLLILILESQGWTASDASNFIKNKSLKDFAFRIKYVPYLSLKVKQFRDVIEDEMETSTLYFNQNAQQVDINAFGERIKAALNMTSNQEPTMTYLSRTPFQFNMQDMRYNLGGKIGQYVPYEVKKEISSKCTTTTIIYSKDFNKWNEYDAIKKNYREWEISENECIEQNPIYNQFCLISDDVDYEAANNIDTSEMSQADIDGLKAQLAAYATELNNKEGFISHAGKVMGSFDVNVNPRNPRKPIEWLVAETSGKEWDETTGNYYDVTSAFLMPVAAFALGNAIVLNAATKDNYSAGTRTEEPTTLSSGYGLEVDIPYSTKYGNAETMKIKCGYGQYSSVVEDNLYQTFLQAKALYEIDSIADADQNIMFEIVNNPLMIYKDSRQKINLTLQLNFISEKDYIWVSSRLAANSSLVNGMADCFVAYFNKKPSRFFNDEVDYGETDTLRVYHYQSTVQGVNMNTPTYYIQPYDIAQHDYVGWGIIDRNHKVLLYYNRAIKAGELGLPLYFQFRDKI